MSRDYSDEVAYQYSYSSADNFERFRDRKPKRQDNRKRENYVQNKRRDKQSKKWE